MDVTLLSLGVKHVPRPERDCGDAPLCGRCLVVIGCSHRLVRYSVNKELHYHDVIRDEFGLSTQDGGCQRLLAQSSGACLMCRG